MYPSEPLGRELDSLRLFTLEPGTWGTTISGNLKHHTFESNPKYETLSYTWGKKKLQAIQVNGQAFTIRKNLYDALTNLRHSSEPRTIWVDAICINQADLKERSDQVRLMSFIYERARSVVIWLGIAPHPLETNYDGWYGNENNYANCRWVYQNAYWKRMWILQEIAIARDFRIQIGSHTFDWGELSLKLLGEHAQALEDATGPVLRLRGIPGSGIGIKIGDLWLENLLEKYQSYECSELRDKIFALLGLAPDWVGEVLKVDYEASYFDIYQQLIDFHQTTRPLGYDFGIANTDADRAAKLMKFSQLVQVLLQYSVNQTRPSSIPSQKFYVARGALAGEIIYIGPTYTEHISSFRTANQWKQEVEKRYRNTGQDAQRARKANQDYCQALNEWEPNRIERIHPIRSTSSYGFRVSAADESLALSDEQISDSSDSTEPRSFLGTRALVGMASAGARVGDLIYSFFSCNVGAVLRSVADDRWMIVGQASLQPMNDYGLRDNQREHLRMQVFNYNMKNPQQTIRGPQKQHDQIVSELTNLRLDIDTLQKLTA